MAGTKRIQQDGHLPGTYAFIRCLRAWCNASSTPSAEPCSGCCAAYVPHSPRSHPLHKEAPAHPPALRLQQLLVVASQPSLIVRIRVQLSLQRQTGGG